MNPIPRIRSFWSESDPVVPFEDPDPRIRSGVNDISLSHTPQRPAPALTKNVLQEAEKWIQRERIDHMLQIIWMYMVACRTEATSEALRLLWNSFPDAYISFKELKTVFGNVFTDKKF
ncbi:hypothetical protein AVEN_46914-1 [Araneus ventricosus]|uniref:Uncharacterized protein n=1 Tax=Araneus ventricosus TaxID=182803 RepID=A0A4Y2U5H1_ARAVE|nr:hypothetical protein AVEN_46914-1 [Araneus ventricosus]